MTQDDQLTKTQVFGMFLLGLSTWVLLGGITYALLKDAVTGVIAAVTGAISVVFLVRWLIYINPDNERR